MSDNAPLNEYRQNRESIVKDDMSIAVYRNS